MYIHHCRVCNFCYAPNFEVALLPCPQISLSPVDPQHLLPKKVLVEIYWLSGRGNLPLYSLPLPRTSFTTGDMRTQTNDFSIYELMQMMTPCSDGLTFEYDLVISSRRSTGSLFVDDTYLAWPSSIVHFPEGWVSSSCTSVTLV